MSFMNPVDMVEEDAADLQFPKARTSKKKCKSKLVKVQVTPATKQIVASYNLQKFNCRLEQESQDHTSSKKDSKLASTIDHQCAYCNKALQEPYVKCADCSAELCLQCFAKGSETKKHKNNHAYVIAKDDIQIFPGPGNWSAREERILLNTLQTQGYGNWEAVSKALKYNHSVAECRQHYHDNYFGGIFERLLGLQHASQTYMPESMPYVVKMRSVDPPRHDDISSMQFKMMAGYRCARADFDTPYDVTAESLLTAILDYEENLNITFNEGEHEDTEVCVEELKLALVTAFNHRLKERQRRYKIMREHGLIMANRCMSWITKYADALRSEQNCKRFLSFMQLCKPMEFDLLMEGLKYFSDLQKAIFRLYELRQNGVRSMIGGSLYFKLKKKRLQEQRERARNERSKFTYDWRKLIPITNANSPLETYGSFFLTPTTNIIPRKKAAPMDVFGLPGFAKLSEDERQLCSIARIVPQSYLHYKNILLAENSKVGYLRLADARRLIKIDVNKTRQIYDFLIEHGHINKPN